MSTSRTGEHDSGVIGRTLRLMLGALLCWMAYTVMSAETNAFNLRVLWVFGGTLIVYLLIHLAIRRFLANLHRWWGALLVFVPVSALFLVGGHASRVAVVGYVGITMLLLAVRGSKLNAALFLPALLSGKQTHLPCILFAPIDLIEKHLSGPGGMPG